MSRRRLPIGIQTFRKIREQVCYFVDKTAFVRALLDQGTHYSLSRPRRFGKSLLLDTLKELFKGSELLFEGLAIHDSMGLVGAPSGGAPELWQWKLQGAGPGSGKCDGAACGHRTRAWRGSGVLDRPRALPISSARPAWAGGPAGGGARRRIRKAEPQCAGRSGGGSSQPQLTAGTLRGRQGCGRAHPVLFEFKVAELSPPGSAMAKLQSRRYADKYRDRGEPIHLVGVEFSRATRNVIAFEVADG